MSITIYPVTPDFVAEVGDIDLSGPLAADDLAAVKAAFWKYAVLIFPGQHLSQDQHLTFAANFGPLEGGTGIARKNKLRIHKLLADVSNLDVDNQVMGNDTKLKAYQMGNRLWHTDASFRRVPAICSLLYAHTVAPIGGHTEFADQRAAYDALPEKLRTRLTGLVAEHSIFTSRARLGISGFDKEEMERLPPVPQVLVRTIPESQRKSLYVAAHAGRILGMPEAEGRALIDELIAHTTQRQFVYTHRWRVHDLVMWDNRCTMHRGTAYDDVRWKRDMHRATALDVANSCDQEGIRVSASRRPAGLVQRTQKQPQKSLCACPDRFRSMGALRQSKATNSLPHAKPPRRKNCRGKISHTHHIPTRARRKPALRLCGRPLFAVPTCFCLPPYIANVCRRPRCGPRLTHGEEPAMSSNDTYEVFAVKYATMQNRYRRDNFIMADNHDAPMPIDYFVWAITNTERTIIVDTGFAPVEGKKRGRNVLRLPREGLAMLGIDAAKVKDVVITHMHYDHAGTLEDFPGAKFHVNDLEMSFVTGRSMCLDTFRHAFTADHVCAMVRSLFEGRVAFHRGDEELAPGVTLHHIGGHTPGMQSVRVKTKRGWVVLASDAAHFYEEFQRSIPFPIVYHVEDMIEGWRKLERLAESPLHVIPGHDPLVLKHYPAPKADLEGIVVRLDVAPKL